MCSSCLLSLSPLSLCLCVLVLVSLPCCLLLSDKHLFLPLDSELSHPPTPLAAGEIIYINSWHEDLKFTACGILTFINCRLTLATILTFSLGTKSFNVSRGEKRKDTNLENFVKWGGGCQYGTLLIYIGIIGPSVTPNLDYPALDPASEKKTWITSKRSCGKITTPEVKQHPQEEFVYDYDILSDLCVCVNVFCHCTFHTLDFDWQCFCIKDSRSAGCASPDRVNHRLNTCTMFCSIFCCDHNPGTIEILPTAFVIVYLWGGGGKGV